MPAPFRFWRAALAALVIAVPSAVQAQQALVWESNLDQARTIAAQTNRLVLIHFGAPWCEPCNELERIVFNHPGFGSTLGASYVAVKLNIDEHVSLARYYGVETIPTDAVISSQGQLIYKTASPRTPDEYVATMSRVAASAGLTAQPPAYAAQNSAAQNSTTQSSPSHSTSSAPFAPPIAGYATMHTGGTPSANYASAAPQPSAAPPAPASPWTAQAAPTPGANASPAPSGLSTPDNRYADYFTNRQATPTGAPSQAAPQGAPWTPQQAAPAHSAPNAAVTSVAAAPIGGTGAPYSSQPGGSSALNTQLGSTAGQSGIAPQNSVVSPTGAAGVVAAQPSSTQAPQIPPGNPPLGLDGFCAVTLCEKRGWQRGDARWGAIHRGRTYLFASDEAQKAFLANPERYSPVASGSDPVLALDTNQDVAGQRQHGVFYDGRIYLFSSKESLDRFSQNPTRYAAEVLQARR